MKHSIESLLNLQSLLTDAIDGATTALLASGGAHLGGLADAEYTCELLRFTIQRLDTNLRHVRACLASAHAKEAASE